MIKAFFLLFEPVVAWDRLAQSRRGVGFILATYLLPTLLIIAAVESWGLVTMGKWQPVFQKTRDFHLPEHLGEVVAFGVAQFLLSLAVVFVSALLIKNISGTFRESHNFRQAFILVAYSLSPLFLLRLLDAIPTMHPMVTWSLGITLTIWVMYQGLPRVLQPDPTHAFGLYISSVIVVVLTSGVVRLVTGLYILGRADFHHSWLTNKFPQLFGQ